jgi:hypothetical protein
MEEAVFMHYTYYMSANETIPCTIRGRSLDDAPARPTDRLTNQGGLGVGWMHGWLIRQTEMRREGRRIVYITYYYILRVEY